MTDKAPTFEEVVAYAVQAGLYGKLPLQKFYDLYEKQGFMYKGCLMDWQAKMQEWADRQTAPVRETGREKAAKPPEQINMALLNEVCRAMGFANVADYMRRATA